MIDFLYAQSTLNEAAMSFRLRGRIKSLFNFGVHFQFHAQQANIGAVQLGVNELYSVAVFSVSLSIENSE